MLRDISRSSLSSAVALDDVPLKICDDFASVDQGLYAFVFLNDEAGHIYDNNKNPQVVVHACGASLKPGKFEQGFGVRLQNYNAHLHWQERNGATHPNAVRATLDETVVFPTAEALVAFVRASSSSASQERLNAMIGELHGAVVNKGQVALVLNRSPVWVHVSITVDSVSATG